MLSVIALAEPLGERIGVVAPVLLLVLSAAVAFVPQVPEVVVDPEIILELIPVSYTHLTLPTIYSV